MKNKHTHYGNCSRCGSLVYGYSSEERACKWGGCNGTAIMSPLPPSNNRLHLTRGWLPAPRFYNPEELSSEEELPAPSPRK